MHLGDVRTLTNKELVDRLLPVVEPTLEMHHPQRRLRMKMKVDRSHPTPIFSSLEQYIFPEITHDRHMSVEIHLGHIDEDRTEHLIRECTRVERPDQTRDVLAVMNIVSFQCSSHALPHRWCRAGAKCHAFEPALPRIFLKYALNMTCRLEAYAGTTPATNVSGGRRLAITADSSRLGCHLLPG